MPVIGLRLVGGFRKNFRGEVMHRAIGLFEGEADDLRLARLPGGGAKRTDRERSRTELGIKNRGTSRYDKGIKTLVAHGDVFSSGGVPALQAIHNRMHTRTGTCACVAKRKPLPAEARRGMDWLPCYPIVCGVACFTIKPVQTDQGTCTTRK